MMYLQLPSIAPNIKSELWLKFDFTEKNARLVYILKQNGEHIILHVLSTIYNSIIQRVTWVPIYLPL